jgi:hypothetical protein
MVPSPREESLINVVRTLKPEGSGKFLDWARQLADLGGGRTIDWSNAWADEDLFDATRAAGDIVVGPFAVQRDLSFTPA